MYKFIYVLQNVLLTSAQNVTGVRMGRLLLLENLIKT